MNMLKNLVLASVFLIFSSQSVLASPAPVASSGNEKQAQSEETIQLAQRGSNQIRPSHEQRQNRPVYRPNPPSHRPPAQRAHRPHYKAYEKRYRIIHDRRMRLFVAGTAAAPIAGSTCYVDKYDYGKTSGSTCCISSGKCFSKFYVN